MIRKNPNVPRNQGDFWPALVASAIKHKEARAALRELRGKNPSLEDACLLAADVMDISPEVIRQDSLEFLADYVAYEFKRADEACRWLANRDRRLGVWAAIACVDGARPDMKPSRFIGKNQRKALSSASELNKRVIGWVEGSVSVQEVFGRREQTIEAMKPLDPDLRFSTFIQAVVEVSDAIYQEEYVGDCVLAAEYAAMSMSEFWYDEDLISLKGTIAHEWIPNFPPLRR